MFQMFFTSESCSTCWRFICSSLVYLYYNDTEAHVRLVVTVNRELVVWGVEKDTPLEVSALPPTPGDLQNRGKDTLHRPMAGF